ncbi:MAG: hypothetical protein ABSH38_20685 [Verrucomicrobiota bacterium]
MAIDDKKQPLDNGAARGTTVEIPSKRQVNPVVDKKSGEKSKRKHKRTRAVRPYPSSSFEEALKLAEAIQTIAAGGRVRRLTLCEQMKISPTSSSTTILITNSGKYGITRGSYAADWIELTPDGKLASSRDTPAGDKLKAKFCLAIEGVKPFNALYEEYKKQKLPAHAVIKDFLQSAKLRVENFEECLDTFIVNAKFLGLLRTIAGSEVLIPIDQAIDEAPTAPLPATIGVTTSIASGETSNEKTGEDKTDWATTCFYISPIGKENSEERKHSDLFLNSIVEPALKEFGLRVVRGDKIGEAGMITSQILEHILKAKLVVVDLSFHNPNAFYELAIRHACKLPIVQIIRKADAIPFDLNQIRTIPIDNTDIYTLIPHLETYRSEVATHVRQALANPDSVSNPLTVFCPGFQITLPP